MKTKKKKKHTQKKLDTYPTPLIKQLIIEYPSGIVRVHPPVVHVTGPPPMVVTVVVAAVLVVVMMIILMRLQEPILLRCGIDANGGEVLPTFRVQVSAL